MEHSAEVNPDVPYDKPLYWAVRNSSKNVTELLIQYGATFVNTGNYNVLFTDQINLFNGLNALQLAIKYSDNDPNNGILKCIRKEIIDNHKQLEKFGTTQVPFLWQRKFSRYLNRIEWQPWQSWLLHIVNTVPHYDFDIGDISVFGKELVQPMPSLSTLPTSLPQPLSNLSSFKRSFIRTFYATSPDSYAEYETDLVSIGSISTLGLIVRSLNLEALAYFLIDFELIDDTQENIDKITEGKPIKLKKNKELAPNVNTIINTMSNSRKEFPQREDKKLDKKLLSKLDEDIRIIEDSKEINIKRCDDYESKNEQKAFKYIRTGNIEELTRLLEEDRSVVELRTKLGNWTLVHAAIAYAKENNDTDGEKKAKDIIKLLVDNYHAPVNEKGSPFGYSPLLFAVSNRQFRVARLLIKRGANPFIKTDDAETVEQFVDKMPKSFNNKAAEAAFSKFIELLNKELGKVEASPPPVAAAQAQEHSTLTPTPQSKPG